MLKAYHENRVLRIPDEKKADYIALGYKITTMGGEVVYDPINNTDNVKALQEGIHERDKIIEDLHAKIAEAEASAGIEALNQRIGELEAAVAERDKIIEDLNAKIAEDKKAAKKATNADKTAK